MADPRRPRRSSSNSADGKHHDPLNRSSVEAAAAAVNILPPHQMMPSSTIVAPRRKAKHHRKRHVPVGPAGVWFQTQQQPQASLGDTRNPRVSMAHAEDGEYAAQQQEEEDSPAHSSTSPRHNRRSVAVKHGSLSLAGSSNNNNALLCILCRLGIVTPSLPAMSTVAQSYKALRPHMPSDYALLPEILAGDHDYVCRKHILVHVQAVRCDVGMATVQDPITGATMEAWIQPALIQEERQRPIPKLLRPGLFWLLQNCTVIIVQHDDTDENYEEDTTLHRLLLVTPDTIRRVWTPAQAHHDVTDQEYIEWMERRNALSTTTMTMTETDNDNTVAPLVRPSQLLPMEEDLGQYPNSEPDEPIVMGPRISSLHHTQGSVSAQYSRSSKSLPRAIAAESSTMATTTTETALTAPSPQRSNQARSHDDSDKASAATASTTVTATNKPDRPAATNQFLAMLAPSTTTTPPPQSRTLQLAAAPPTQTNILRSTTNVDPSAATTPREDTRARSTEMMEHSAVRSNKKQRRTEKPKRSPRPKSSQSPKASKLWTLADASILDEFEDDGDDDDDDVTSTATTTDVPKVSSVFAASAFAGVDVDKLFDDDDDL